VVEEIKPIVVISVNVGVEVEGVVRVRGWWSGG